MITFVIPVWNRSGMRFDGLIRFLNKQSIRPDVYIVNSSSNNAHTQAIEESIEREDTNNIVSLFNIRPTQEFLFSQAVNYGIKKVDAEYCCVMGSDILLAENFVECLLSKLSYDKKLILSYLGYMSKDAPYLDVDNSRELIKYVDKNKLEKMYAPGTIQACATSWFKRIGGFDEDFMYGLDDDIIHRARMDGLEIDWMEFSDSDSRAFHVWHEIVMPQNEIPVYEFMSKNTVVRNNGKL